ncbi:alpha/beta hydrolase [Rhodanobacter sp. MP1X3]|uniref:alpha/beta hydrolase n=1 Tax=Rhodanobacter sp. MP1X3 TaxID=2723086 RepID=UPI001608C1B9|nr:alpha/beta hydrolase [Rhodanobacter sp. MP1X3]MBB6241556.1 acetyl esterase/lipase [Rhodanobacter sp. MP1X3]
MPSDHHAPSPRPRRSSLLAAILLTLSAGLLTGCQATLFAGLNATSHHGDVIVDHDVTFDAEHGLAMDIYRLPHTEHAPVVVYFYGGSWKSGKRQWYRFVGEALAKRGLVVMIPDYRLWPKVKLDGFMQDGARAVAWTHTHAGEYGGDNKELFVMGHSAGAHIAALLATDAHWLADDGMQPRQLAGFIGLAGPYDFLPLKDPDFVDMFGPTHEAQLRSQPVHFVNGDEPPMLLMQGTTDKIVWPRNTLSLAAAMRREHEPVEVKLYPGIGHFALLFSLSEQFRSKAPALNDTVDFIHTQVMQRRQAASAL